MENLDLIVLRTLLEWRQAGKSALLATVVHTWGSSPRPVGSIMALCEGGAVVGSVSGGCIEDDLIHRFREVLQDGPPQRVRYGVSADEAHRFGLPCGC
jgi:xanthine dehydrogenase accessory factor